MARRGVTTAGLPYVELRGITKQYPGVLAVDDVDLTFDGHARVGLVGKNGAGKSTLIKIMAGAVGPTGASPRRRPRRSTSTAHTTPPAGLAFVHQDLHDVPGPLGRRERDARARLPAPRPLVDWTALRRQAAEVLHRLEVDIDRGRWSATSASPIDAWS